MFYIELDFIKVFIVFFRVYYYLDKIATTLLFTNIVRKFTFVYTEVEVSKLCLKLNQVATKA